MCQGQPIKAGEFILGYPGEGGILLPTPQPDILARNGTYVGFRKYQSRVGAFNRFLRANGSTDEERELIAAKLVGRWRSGAPLTLAPDKDDPALGADQRRNNDFDYAKDPHGRQIPFGSHIRRMNPRDTQLTRLTDVNIHRLIRRGTTFGLPYDPNAVSCPITLTVHGRLATRLPTLPTSSPSRVRRTRRARYSPCAFSPRPAKLRSSRTSSITGLPSAASRSVRAGERRDSL